MDSFDYTIKKLFNELLRNQKDFDGKWMKDHMTIVKKFFVGKRDSTVVVNYDGFYARRACILEDMTLMNDTFMIQGKDKFEMIFPKPALYRIEVNNIGARTYKMTVRNQDKSNAEMVIHAMDI